MKIKFYTLLLIPFMVLLSSCEGLLNLYPEDEVTPETFFRNETDLELFTNNFYTANLPAAADVYYDQADIIISPMLDAAVAGQRVIPETGSGWSWTALRQINYFLENSSKCEDEEVRDHYNAVARFFRAYFYFEKVKRFGDVPWYDQVLGSADKEALSKPRDPRNVVVENILKDLDWAYEHIRPVKDVYRINKWAVLALKSRVCLFEGTFLKYHGITDRGDWKTYLEECAKASKTLMDEGGYELFKGGSTPYATLFNQLDADQGEIILARDYNMGLGLKHAVQDYVTQAGNGNTGVTRRLVDSYLMKDGTRYTDKPKYDETLFVDEVVDRDPRLAQTIRTPGYKDLEGNDTPITFNNTKLGYQLRKFFRDKSYNNGSSDVDIPYFRLAEVYLNYAEAKAELGEITQADLDATINKLRARAGITGMLSLSDANDNPCAWMTEQYPNVTKSANTGVILEVRRERTVELVMEGFRYYDIMRWKEGKCFEKPFLGMYFPGPGEYDVSGDGKPDINLFVGSAGASSATISLELGGEVYLTEKNATDSNKHTVGNLEVHKALVRTWNENRDYFYPIPTKERILTQGAIEQNPGWDDGLTF